MEFVRDHPESSKVAIKSAVTGEATALADALEEMSDGDSAVRAKGNGLKNALLFRLSAHGNGP